MVTHTGKKVQKCAECGDSFPRPFILKTHMLTHSGKKPHNYTQSDFASSRVGNLRDHKKIHSLEKPINANDATTLQPKKYTLPNICSGENLKKHMTRHSTAVHQFCLAITCNNYDLQCYFLTYFQAYFQTRKTEQLNRLCQPSRAALSLDYDID